MDERKKGYETEEQDELKKERKGEGDDLTMSKMMIRVYLVESDTERITLIT